MIAPDDDPLVFRWAFEKMLKTIEDYASTTSAHMGQIIGPTAGVLFGIYMLFWHMALVTGSVSEPLTDFYKRCMRAVVIIMLATTSGIYNDVISDFVWEVPSVIAGEVVSPGSSTSRVEGANATATLLDQTLGLGLKAGQNSWQKMSTFSVIGSIGYAFIALTIWLCVGLVCAYAGALVLVANIGTAIMLGLGPLFIILLMFEATSAYFTSWVRQLTTFMIQFLIIASIMALMFHFFMDFVRDVHKADGADVILEFTKTVISSALCLLVLHQAQNWSASLAGGVSITAAGAIGNLARGAKNAVVNTRYNPDKKNKDGTRGGKELGGAVGAGVATARGTVAAARAVKRSFQKRNSVKNND